MNFEKYKLVYLPIHPSDKESRKKQYQEYQRLTGLKETEFYNDLLEEFNVTDNPKAAKCYSIAWGFGHSAGYEEVYYYFSELVELIK